MKILFIILMLATVAFCNNPVVTNIQLLAGLSGTSVATNLEVDKNMVISFKIKDADGFTNINWIKIVIYDTNVSTLTSSDASSTHTTFWYFYDPAAGWVAKMWTLNESYCSVPAGTNTSTGFLQFKLAFKVSSDAKEETTKSWRIYIIASSGIQTSDGTNFISVGMYKYPTLPPSGEICKINFYAYPNPFYVSQDKQITFVTKESFSAEVKISLDIYDMAGKLVKNIAKDKVYASGSLLNETWDGKNEIGANVLSSAYLAILTIKSDKGSCSKTFKIAIIR